MAKKTNNLLNHPAFAALRLGEQVFEAQEFTPKSENSAVGTDHGITLKLYGRKSDAFKKAYPAHQAAMAKAEERVRGGLSAPRFSSLILCYNVALLIDKLTDRDK